MIYYNVLKSIARNKLGLINYPTFITFLVTWRCNGRCIFCDVWKKRVDFTKDELNLDEIKKIFKQLKSVDVIRLTGGEPFLRPDLSEIINAIDAINNPSMVHITSNGMLGNVIINSLKKVKKLNKIHIKISIDNVGQKHDDTRGVPNAYKNAMHTVNQLVELREKYGLHVGVNQTIPEEKELNSYFELKKILDKLNVPIYPIIASEPTNSLYSNQGTTDPTFKPFGEFSKKSITKFTKTILEDSKQVNDFKEKLVDSYHLKGFHNRLVNGINKPNPKCVALNNHMRLLPNGDVPICLYNARIVGNLKKDKFKDVWFGNKIKKHRKWVANCPGCWQSCESAVSAIYTGDIWKGLFY